MKALDALLEEGVRAGVFGTARAEVWHDRRRVYAGGSAAEDARFDLASLTKVVATTALLCRVCERGALDVTTPVKSVLPETAVDASIEDLALHRSGLPAFVPSFAELTRTHPALFSRFASAAERREVRELVQGSTLRTPPAEPVGTRAVYSDVGFIMLGAILERVTKRSLDQLFVDEVAAPLGLDAGFRRLSESTPDPHIVPTGGTRPREPAPGQEGLWRCSSWPSIAGEVDDDNAWVMDGVAGHAGLFATAHAVAMFGQALLDGRLRAPTGWAADRRTPGSTRAFGFDTPSAEGASCGARFGRAGPLGAIGHLGFTGTSLWIDLDRQLVVVLLTNRVVFGRANVQIRAFRPRFHDAVLSALGG